MYISFAEQKEAVKKIDIVELAQSMGFTLQKVGSYYRLKEHDSCMINPMKNTFFQYSAGLGGDTIQFVEHFLSKTFPEAMQILLEKQGMPIYTPPTKEAIKKEFVVPDVDNSTDKIKKYFISRSLSPKVFKACIENGSIYQEAGKYSNVIYVGCDKDGVIRFGAKESAMLKIPKEKRRFKQDISGSDKAYSFHIPPKTNSAKLVICESPIDAMSYASLLATKNIAWDTRHYLSLGGVSEKALHQFLQDHKEVKSVTIALDNDDAGKNATKRIEKTLSDMGYEVKAPITLKGKDKDYNDMLKRIKVKEKNYER